MITKKEIENLANLSRIDLSPQEAEDFGKDLQNLVDYVSQLDELDLSDVEPTSQVTGLMNVLRPDNPRELNEAELLKNREELLQNADKVQNGHVVVPAVFDN